MHGGLRLFSYEESGEVRVGAEHGGSAFDLSGYLRSRPGCGLSIRESGSMRFLIGSGLLSDRMLDEFRPAALAGGLERFRLDSMPKVLLPPVPDPTKILALARNYAAHAAESGSAVPAEPVAFPKLPSSLAGHGSDVTVPARTAGRIDHEVELAVVIGLKARRVDAVHAMECVFGYTVFNDVTARDLQREDMRLGRPWARCKSQDTFGPCGPWIVPRREVPDPHALRISLRVNGEIRQDSSTAGMVFRIPELIEALSANFTLMPGDIIATGTPEGVGPVRSGDVMEAEIEGIGKLVNRVTSGE